jgi:hypothetical protein
VSHTSGIPGEVAQLNLGIQRRNAFRRTPVVRRFHGLIALFFISFRILQI